MAALTAIALGLTALETGLKAKGDFDAAKSAQAQGNYTANIYSQDAAMADAQAADAIARGKVAETQQRQQTQGLIGTQRAAYGASGVQLNDGSALDVQKDTAYLGELDALTIRNNAAREQWGFQVEAFNYRQQGLLAKRAGANAASAYRNSAYSTILGGATEAFGMLYHPGFGGAGSSSAGKTGNFGKP